MRLRAACREDLWEVRRDGAQHQRRALASDSAMRCSGSVISSLGLSRLAEATFVTCAKYCEAHGRCSRKRAGRQVLLFLLSP